MRALDDDAAILSYAKACDQHEAEGCYAMATYWSMKMTLAVDAERSRCADQGLAYADRALALKPNFVLALVRKQFFWENQALLGDPARSDAAFAKARALKAQREALMLRLRARNDPDLFLGRQHDFESRPLHDNGPVAVAAGQPRSLGGGAGFECASAPLEPLARPKTSGKPTVVLVRWTAPEGTTAWLPIDEAPPYERTHLDLDGKSYAPVAVRSDMPPPPGSSSTAFSPLSNFLPDGPGGRKLMAMGHAYRLLFDLPVSAVGRGTLRAVMEVPATGARYVVDCSLDAPRQ